MKASDMSISAFSRRSLLSPKALRLYDQMGLLRPNRIDPETGYRYYHESQLETARLISLLRKLEMPLAAIADVIKLSPDEASLRLDSWWQDMVDMMEQRGDLLQYIRGIVLDDSDVRLEYSGASDVKLREVPETSYLYVTRHVTGPELPEYIGRSSQILRDRSALYGGVHGPLTAVFHGLVDMDSDGPVDICIPIRIDQEPLDGDLIRKEAAHTQAYATLVKRQVEFPQILRFYHAIRRWIDAEGHEISGSPREIYLADYDLVTQNDPICEIAFPIRLKQGVHHV